MEAGLVTKISRSHKIPSEKPFKNRGLDIFSPRSYKMSKVCNEYVGLTVKESHSNKGYKSMTNLMEQARAGRITALENRATRHTANTSILGDPVRASARRRNEMPIFISSRSGPETHVFLN